MLSDKELNKLNEKRLRNVLNSARAVANNVLSSLGPRCCEICNEYIGDDYERDVVIPAKKYTDYRDKIKNLLNSKYGKKENKKEPELIK